MEILTAYGALDRSLVVRDRLTYEDANEKTLALEYRLTAPLRLPDGRVVLPGELVKRSAHVHIKQWPCEARALDGFFGRNSGITPTDSEPGRQAKKLARILGRGFRFANSQAMCTSFKQDILNGLHAFGSSVVRGGTTKDSFQMALFLASGSLGAATTVYSTTSELAGTGNYTQGGNAVTNATTPTTSGTTAYWTPSASVSWANLTSSGSFDCSLLYNNTAASKNAVAVFTFGAQSITAGTFTLTMPTNDSSNALIRIA
jgi:hypothetical protein